MRSWMDWNRLCSAGLLTDNERDRRLNGPLRPDDIEDLLEDTAFPACRSWPCSTSSSTRLRW